MEIKRNYDIYHGALAELIQLLGAGKINAFFDQPTQSYRDGFEKQYVSYLQQNDKLYQMAVEDSNSSYSRYLGADRRPDCRAGGDCGRLAQHQADADLSAESSDRQHSPYRQRRPVKRIEVQGTNEMGELADSLRHMQGELVRTVGDVRNGANAIYSGASEIAMGNNDLSSRTEQQAASRKRPLPAWSS